MSEDQERNYLILINGLPQLLWTSGPDGQWDFVNERWREFAGVPIENHLGSGWLERVHEEDRQRTEETWRAAREAGIASAVELRLRRQDGVYRWFDARVMPLCDSSGAIVKWLGSLFDIEERRQAEEALRRTEAVLRVTNDSLEQRVRARTAELEARSEQLRALALDLAETESRERKRLAHVLHDHFQQLISAARIKIGVLRRRPHTEADIESLRQTDKLLEEALCASRTLATELSPPVLHDAGLAAALIWLARRIEQTHHLIVKLNLDSSPEPDNEQVRTILYECVRELLFNVVKHSGVKEAELSAAATRDGLLEICVADHGKGFDARRTERTRRPDGSFGLFSIHERLALIGGLVKVSSAPGSGTSIRITVPAAAPPPKETRVEPSELTPIAVGRVVRVLVADDHKLFREGLISLLNQEPYLNVIGEAGDGVEAIELAHELHPDIMILDVTMPRLNGVQVATKLTRELPGVRIIGLSMHERDDMAKAMCAAGAVAYCAKSAPIESLVNILRGAAAADGTPTTSPSNP
ncbi:MAG TPA: response regulator [Tepidisphaeraceae bacterium]|nr:response regulator [Tepidisphaeraceae bacterium]